MKKQLAIVLVAGFLLSGCSFTEKKKTLKNANAEVLKKCANTEAIEQAGKNLVKDKSNIYCAIDTDRNLDKATAFVKKDYNALRISEFLRLSYYHKELTDRYIAYDDKKKSVEDVVTYVNIGLDQPYFTNMAIIQDTEDMMMLINKYNRLPDDYEPKNLVRTPNACVIGQDYSCQSEPQYLCKEAANAFAKLVQAGKAEKINIKAIASYRSFAYQKNLYDYYAQSEGEAYADKYYARPGHSEYNSALAVDVTIDDQHFNEIENSEHYDWLLKHIADYGFILRYPKDKAAVTGYQYESWHLRYVGKAAAKEIVKQGITLDEYIARKDASK